METRLESIHGHRQGEKDRNEGGLFCLVNGRTTGELNNNRIGNAAVAYVDSLVLLLAMVVDLVDWVKCLPISITNEYLIKNKV